MTKIKDKIEPKNSSMEGSNLRPEVQKEILKWKNKQLMRMVPALFVVILLLAGILIAQRLSSSNQDVRSQASTPETNINLRFSPESMTIDKNQKENLNLSVDVPSEENVSLVQIRILFDPNIINIVSMSPKVWQEKRLIVLEEFSIGEDNGNKVAKMTVGVPCDKESCHPLTGSAEVVNIEIEGLNEGSSSLINHSSSDQDMTTIITSIDQQSNSWNAEEISELRVTVE